MKEQENKELDILLKTAIKDLKPEEVSIDFNRNLFQKIAQIERKKVVQTPLIPKIVWLALALFLIGVLGIGFTVETNTEFWLLPMKFNTIGNLDFFNLEMEHIKWDTTSYAMLGFVIFIMFQILFLKQYFSKHKVII